MGLETSPTEDDIVTRLKTIIPRVYTTEVEAGVSPVYPLIVAYFGTPVRMAHGRSIMSTRQDALRGYGRFDVAAPTDAAARVIKDRILDSMVGYRPTNAGEMTLEGGAQYARASLDGGEPLYYRSVALSWVTNLAYND